MVIEGQRLCTVTWIGWPYRRVHGLNAGTVLLIEHGERMLYKALSNKMLSLLKITELEI